VALLSKPGGDAMAGSGSVKQAASGGSKVLRFSHAFTPGLLTFFSRRSA
jgi:hypothetical protein